MATEQSALEQVRGAERNPVPDQVKSTETVWLEREEGPESPWRALRNGDEPTEPIEFVAVADARRYLCQHSDPNSWQIVKRVFDAAFPREEPSA